MMTTFLGEKEHLSITSKSGNFLLIDHPKRKFFDGPLRSQSFLEMAVSKIQKKTL